MKTCYKKISAMFTIALVIILGSFLTVFADDGIQSVKINNTTLSFNRIIYVDGTNGNDITGDGSTKNPYQSITKAQTVAMDGNAVYIRKGTYDLSSTGNGLYESKHKLTFIGEPNGTIIISDGTKNTGRDNHAAAFKTDCSVYNIIFKYTAGNRTTNYSCALIGNGHDMSSDQYGNFYNCVFISTDKAPAPCYTNKSIYVQFKNCSFIIPNDFQKDYTYNNGDGDANDHTIWINCAISKNLYTTGRTSTTITSTTCIGNVNISNSDYNITSDGWQNIGTGTNPDGTQANLGVYGGQFAWGNWESSDKSITLNKSTLTIKEGDTEDLIATTTPEAVNVVWSSSDESTATVDQNGKVTGVKEGQATITAQIKDTDIKATCIVTVTKKDVRVEPEQPVDPEGEYIINTAYAKGDNTNKGSGSVTIIFHGATETTLGVVKTADVKEVWVGDNFTYTIVVTNTGSKTAKGVVISDDAPNHISFKTDEITTTKGEVDENSTAKKLIVNVGDILPGESVTIKVPVTVVE